jgi:hypothetical protein
MPPVFGFSLTIDSSPRSQSAVADSLVRAKRRKASIMARYEVRWVVALAVLAEVLVVTHDVQAQGRRRFFAVPIADLASLEQVQNDLKLSDEQKTKTSEIANQFRSDRRDLFQQGFSEETRQKMEQLNHDATVKVLEILDDTQRGRLTGIYIQVNGVRALNEPVVTEALKFTEEQNKKLAEVNEATREAFRSVFSDSDGQSREERQAKFAKVADEGEQKMMDVLTPEQKQQFEQLKGEPIDVDTSSLRPGRRGN